jgi:hypothetical protein
MADHGKLTNLEQLLDRIEGAVNGSERVSLGEILRMVGRRSFGPLLLLAGVIAVSPIIGDMPGIPTTVGVFVLLIAGQMLFQRDYFWLPPWILRRSVSRVRLCQAIKWLRRPARSIDRLLRPRLTLFTYRTGAYGVAVVCAVIAAAMPVMEMVPLVANGAGAALTAFGLSLVAHDGLLAILAFVFTAITIGLTIYGLL